MFTRLYPVSLRLQFSHARLGLACMIDNRLTSLSIRVVDRYACLRRPLRRTRWCSKEVRGRGHGLTRSRTSWTLRLCQIKRCMKTYSMPVCKAQGIGIELTFLTVEGLPEPKTAVPLQLKCHALPGTGASPPQSSRHGSDVNLAACQSIAHEVQMP